MHCFSTAERGTGTANDKVDVSCSTCRRLVLAPRGAPLPALPPTARPTAPLGMRIGVGGGQSALPRPACVIHDSLPSSSPEHRFRCTCCYTVTANTCTFSSKSCANAVSLGSHSNPLLCSQVSSGCGPLCCATPAHPFWLQCSCSSIKVTGGYYCNGTVDKCKCPPGYASGSKCLVPCQCL